MLWEILLCALAAALILGLLWLLLAQFLLPIRAKEAFLVLLGQGDGENLEQNCRAYLLLRSAGMLRRPLLLVDDGLSEEGLALARQLTLLDSSILLCRFADLQQTVQSHPI